ncbi:MAG: citramalate synthase, partial [Oscillospiraceae bacterium]|nr:citramalate synthase [Oscillospiraceae bacterium]
VGIHCHNDTGCAIANSMMAVEAGASHVQGTYIGFGERCGNANLSAIIANLQLKQGYECIPAEKMRRLTKTARYIAEIANLMLPGSLPYVGKSAFAHKGGMHVDGVTKNPHSFEHIDPEQVGTHRNLLLSEVSGRSAIAARMSELDSSITRNSIETAEFIEMLKERELEGYQFESADASLEIFALKYLGKYRPAFELEYFKILGEQPAVHVDRSASAMVKVKVDGQIEMTAAEGDGPVHALDVALRRALEVFYPSLHKVRLVDYKVRVIEGHAATAAMVRVIIVSTDGESTWTTVGVSADIIDASWQALRDSIEYKLLHDHAV